MGKRVSLFLLTNAAILAVVSVILYFVRGTGILPERSLYLVFGLCFVWGMGGALISLALSRWIAKWSMGVELIDGRTGDQRLDQVYAQIQQLAQKAGIPMPEVGYYESDEVNAFATGPSAKRSLVAVSTGLLLTMSPDEVEGVLAHEVAHIANGDMVTMTLIQGVINAFVLFFARLIAWAVRLALDEDYAWIVSFIVYILMVIFLSILGSLITNWFSRRREFSADQGGAAYSSRAKMIAALERLKFSVEGVDHKSNPAQNAYKISGKQAILNAFSTHPPLDKRIAALRGVRQ